MRPDRPGRGIALMIVAMAMLASLDAVGKLATQTYPVSQVLFLRFALFLAFALALAARRGGVGRYVIFHHAPEHTDEDMDRIADEAQGVFASTVVAREGLVLRP